MAVTIQYSSELTNQNASPVVVASPDVNTGKLRVETFEFTQATANGDAGSYAYLVKLPAGKVKVILPLSRIAHSALGALRTLDLGWLAYEDKNGVTVSDVSASGSFNPSGTVGGAETYTFESKEGVTISAQINGATLDVGNTLKGYIIYVKE
jgi:hypothetical protein